MTLEKQVCTLIQAKRLKELGVMQKSLAAFIDNKLEFFKTDIINWAAHKNIETASAFTVAELGEMMKDQPMPFYWHLWEGWCFKQDGQPKGYGTEAESRAALLIHLLEKKHIAADQVNSKLNDNNDNRR